MRPQAFSDEYKVDNDSRDGQRDARSLAKRIKVLPQSPQRAIPTMKP